MPRMRTKHGMILITLNLPKPWIDALDGLVPKYYPNRAEAIRTAVRDMLKREAWKTA